MAGPRGRRWRIVMMYAKTICRARIEGRVRRPLPSSMKPPSCRSMPPTIEIRVGLSRIFITDLRQAQHGGGISLDADTPFEAWEAWGRTIGIRPTVLCHPSTAVESISCKRGLYVRCGERRKDIRNLQIQPWSRSRVCQMSAVMNASQEYLGTGNPNTQAPEEGGSSSIGAERNSSGGTQQKSQFPWQGGSPRSNRQIVRPLRWVFVFLFPPLNTREENACKRWAVNGPVSTNSRRTRRFCRMSRMQTAPPCCPIPCLIGRLSAYGVVCLVACPPSSSIPPTPTFPLADARLIDNRAAFPKRTSEHMFPLKGVLSTQSRQSRKGMKPQRTSREAGGHGRGKQGRV
ncbi:uncharacterized protein BDZ83DRAFT_455554 [Colletotrichum acutatum]|uniref:Uncharacterized protein n=1 Tax=Glomerella acutata TaxID=27357 RepID=A0AAD8UD45_GLOAC|nr:uncharacterized protein BDZ83DRAFT_455554 [Colletotrichum acutatum]KAK1720260.1 hypothetical protein BDZ83DRAFT_455554 [Colletotrichum acutatum]